MAEKKTFLNWVGYKDGGAAAPNSIDRIRELESQLNELRARRDINGLTKEEFEILATETAMAMIKSAQSREAKAVGYSERIILETNRQAKDVAESAETKARSILSGAEARGRKYIITAEAEANERVAQAEREAQAVYDEKRREVAALAQAARREGERIVLQATNEVAEYRQWLSGVISEAERLYRIQTQSLDAAEQAINQSRSRLDSAYSRLAELHKNVTDNLNADNTVIHTGPKKVLSQRTKPELSAPAREAPAKKSAVKKKSAKRR
ncbi:MAG: hypothetical protein QNL07_00755 [Candidatus Planktophila sp.]